MSNDTAADEPAQLYYTSGTTGLAKGIVHAHRYLLAHNEFELCHEVQDGERFHGMGEWAWAAGIAPLLGPWRLGAVQVVLQRQGGFDPEASSTSSAATQVTNVFTTPTAMRSMMAIDDAATRYPCDFRRVCSAGEPLNPEAIRWFREQYGLTVLDYYGLTESYPLCGNFPWMEVREGSMGRPMPGWDVRSSTRTSARSPRASAARSACARAPTRTTRSATGATTPRRPRPSVATGFTPRTPRPPMRTATSGTPAAPTTSSSRRAIASGRSRSSRRASSIRRSARPRRSRRPTSGGAAIVKAFIVLVEGHEPSEALGDEIKAFVRDRLSAYAYPRRIEFVEDLPKTLTGKIRRIELREREASGWSRE